MLKRSNIFGYGEVNQYNRSSRLMSAYKHLEHQQFLYYVIREKGEIYNAFDDLLPQAGDGGVK